MRNYNHNTANGIWANILQWRDNNGRVGFLAEYINDGNVQLHINNEHGDIFINNNSIEKLTNDVNNINSRIDTSLRKVSINNLLRELSLNSESGVVDFLTNYQSAFILENL